MSKILMYHSIGGGTLPEPGAHFYQVPLERFSKQLEYVAFVTGQEEGRVRGKGQIDRVKGQGSRVKSEGMWQKELVTGHRLQVTGTNGVRPASPAGRRSAFGRRLTRGPWSLVIGSEITITFDDGLLDNYTKAFPLLKEFGIKAYLFVMPAKIGSAGYMSWEQLKELKANGMIIGSHGMTHKILTNLSVPELRYELFDSKRILEEKLGSPVNYFSIPRGFNRKKIIKLAKEAGYKKVFTSDWRDNDGYSCGRIAITAGWSDKRFVNLINNGFTLRDKFKHSLKKSAKGMLGASGYDKLRTLILKRDELKRLAVSD